MSVLLQTKRIASELEQLIKSSEKFICIFTYSLKIDSIFIERLKAAGRRGVKITFVFGVEPKDLTTLQEIQKIDNCQIYFKEYLHAKFYYSESTLIIATMNLSEVSEARNYELGVLFKKEIEPAIFEEIKQEAREIVGNASQWKSGKVAQAQSFQMPAFAGAKKQMGHCIRCFEDIHYHTSRPFCLGCYDIWNTWGDEYYEENFCHKCGTDKEYTSKAKPECNKCYNSHF
ncbi:MAG: hypothetical protein EOO46_11685 [Flavobacterium sp.]|nr:MAG: hypothetical protein EOO46_11685 [Flavobacterium sp.]